LQRKSQDRLQLAIQIKYLSVLIPAWVWWIDELPPGVRKEQIWSKKSSDLPSSSNLLMAGPIIFLFRSRIKSMQNEVSKNMVIYSRYPGLYNW